MVSKSNRLPYLVIAITTALLLILTLAGLSIVTAAPATLDASKSVKQVDKAEALPGDMLSYTIVITNAGTGSGSFVLTDTLPMGLSYIPNTLILESENAFGQANASGNTITATGSLSAATLNPEIKLTFGVTIANTIVSGTILTNEAQLDDGSGVHAIVATTKVVSQTDSFVYLPIIFNAAPAPALTVGSVTADSGSNYNQKWTVSWNSVGPVNSYIVEESTDADFSNIISTVTVNGLSRQYSHGASLNPSYYYRVRYADGAGGAWSNVVNAVGAYRDDFSANNGGWQKVRQDLDDTQNVLSYHENGFLKMHVQGRWDYFISSPLQPTPAGDYQLETRAKFDGAGNLNTYGIILGADWNGNTCPTLIQNPDPVRSVDNSVVVLDPNELEESHIADGDSSLSRATIVDNCFNHYYRIMLLWKGDSNEYNLQVKRIIQHESPKNNGQGYDIVSTTSIPIDDQNGWNSWRVEVRRSTGQFKLFANNNQVASWTDTTYINDVYWGLWASTDEYPGSDPLYDYVNVRPLP